MLHDQTLAFFSNPYGYIRTTCATLGTDVFETRILLQPTICMTGPQAAEVFYDTSRFQRHGAAPEPLRATLFGKHGVQTLDAATHLRRKALLMQILEDDNITVLADIVQAQWQAQAAHYTGQPSVALYGMAHDVLTRAVCQWAGVPLANDQALQRTHELVALFNDAARGLVPHLRSRLARQRLQDWLGRLITQARQSAGNTTPSTALYAIAHHRNHDGKLLNTRTAAVELLNILRPIVAVSVFIVWAAHALLQHPDSRARLTMGDKQYQQWFLQEVRRYYPFFPAIAARVKKDFEWNGVYFRKGQRTLLDLFGTNHDSRIWQAPETFNPERFRDLDPNAFEFIPQGGGHARHGHRCPGEQTTLTLMDVSVSFLINALSQHASLACANTDIDAKRLPALPRAPIVLEFNRRH